MTPTLPPAATTVVCHVRPSLVLDPVDSKVETLETCESEGTIDSLLLRSWPAEVALQSEGTHPEVVERFQRFQAWAERNDVSIEPPFRIRNSTSVASETETETLVTPGICLALYHDQQLRAVVPHVDEETTYSVPETIASLRTGTTPKPLASATPVDRSRASGADTSSGEPDRVGSQETSSGDRARCPHCDRSLANVQGLLACVECKWSSGETQIPLAHH